MHIIDEADRCYGCKKPMCQLKGCPVATHIPEVIKLFQAHNLERAGDLLFDNNPMSCVCALVCNHGAQCEGSCIQGRKGSPIHFSAIESYISDSYLDRYIDKIAQSKAAPTHKSCAIIGSGPAGIVAAIKLAQAGCDVTMFEQQAKIGGVLEYGIPEFRLPKRYVERYRRLLEALGVRIRVATTIGGALKIDDLLHDGYNSVFVGTGSWRARTLGIKGQTRGDVFFGIDYLINPSGCEIGKSVAVIGVGNVAMDVARTALRQGARKVELFSNWGGVSATSDEFEFAMLDGATVSYGLSVFQINDKGPRFYKSILDDKGMCVGLSSEEVQTEFDSTIFCVSQVPKNKLAMTTKGLELTDAGTLVVDEHYMSTVPGVFAAGDVVTGPKTVVHAVAGAKAAVQNMLEYMGVSDR